MVEVWVLGPVQAVVEGEPVVVGSAKQRIVLASLALAGGVVVSTDALVDAVWGEDLPAEPLANLQSFVSRLRSLVGADAIVFDHGGYRFAPGAAGTDVGHVHRLADEARGLRPDRPAEAAVRLTAALERWRGPALGDLADNPALLPEAVRLEEQRLTLIDQLHGDQLDAGQVHRALPGLEAAAVATPLRASSQLLLMRGLHAAGRSAEALRVADRYRRRLAEESGLDPTPELGHLEQAILAGESTAAAPSDASDRAAVHRRRPIDLPRLGRFVGRERELVELQRCLAHERLVSVLGPGGVGKTRLVAEVLGNTQAAPRQAVVVPLAGVTEPDVVAAVAAALDLRAGVEPLDRAVIDYLTIEEVLLVLDNCEHVVASVRTFTYSVLAGCPRVTVLATTRERLGIPAERVLELRPLAVDDEHEHRTPGAIEMFVDRARRAAPNADLTDSAAIATLCRRVDGVPLALELAAGRVAALGVAGLLERLDEALDLLAAPGSDAFGRHDTLRAVIDWSYRLVDPDAAALLHSLAVFEPGFGLDAVEAVGGTVVVSPAAAISRLVDASLVVVDHSGSRARYRILEAVRAYASERLAGTRAEVPARAAHAVFYIGFLARAVTDVAGPRETAAAAAVFAERDNIRRALRWVTDQRDGEAVANAAASLARLLLYRPDAELLSWMREATDTGHTDPTQFAAAMGAAARAAFLQGDLAACERIASDAANRLTRESLSEDADLVWHSLGVVHLYRGNHEAAIDWWTRVTEHASATAISRADALGGIALARLYAGDRAGAAVAAAELADVARELDSDTYRSFSGYITGELSLTTDHDEGAEILARAADLARTTGAHFLVGLATTALLSTLVRSHRPAEALPRVAELIEHWRRSSTWTQQWTTLRLLAELLAEEGRGDVAALLLEAADRDAAAPAVTGADARRLAALRDALTEQVPEARWHEVQRQARTWSRPQVIDLAMAAVAELQAALRS